MVVNDGQENSGTLGWRLSPLLCGYALKNHERSGSVYSVKPCHIRSRVSRSPSRAFPMVDTHNSCSGRYAQW